MIDEPLVSIDLSKIEKLRTTSEGWVGRCPVCALDNKDNKCAHLGVKRNGEYNCIFDSSHNKGIYQLIGKSSDGEFKTVQEVRVEKIQSDKKWPISILNGLIKNYDYWNNRNISDEICRKFEIGVATKYALYNRSVIPIFNQQKTEIIGFTARKIENDSKRPKWLHMGAKNKWIWPYQPEEIKKYESAILVESPGCSLALEQNDIKNSICLFGVDISPAVISYLIKLNPNKIAISTNNELNSANKGVGNKKAQVIYNKLLQFFNQEKLIIAHPFKKDFGEMDSCDIIAWKNKYL